MDRSPGMLWTGMLWIGLLVVGCSSAAKPEPQGQATSSPSTATACPDLPAPPAGKCRSNADCTGDYVECAWGKPAPRPRQTGSGALFGTDGAQCEHGYRPATPCPGGLAFRTRPAPNLCPIPECIPRCAPASCAAGETCDQGTGLCRPISCMHGWGCAKEEICQHGPNADEHGCAPRCPGYGTCVVYGPPSP